MIARRMRHLRDEGGFALIYTLFVTTLITIAVATTLTVTAPNITASKRSQDVSAAQLAAESGIQDAVAYLTNVPACRSETRICSQALGARSSALGRPGLGTNQSFSWTTGSTATADGYVRVTSTGAEGGVKRTLVADLSLNPSILNYGYYTDYESLSPGDLNSYYVARKIYVSSSTAAGNVTAKGNGSAPETANWNGATTSSSTGYPDTICGQHWYSDSASSPGRSTTNSYWVEAGSLNGTNQSRVASCDLVFTTGMDEKGLTYTRDAMLVADAGGKGPLFEGPVYTLWGYGTHTSPAPTAGTYFRQNAGNDTVDSSGYQPAVATQDITLPTTVGTDGIQTNSCVYYGPTRVVLNGDGTATVNSPDTTSPVSGADAGCYPTGLGATGMTNFTLNYATTGSGTIYVKNLSTPTGGVWPQSSLTSQSTPSAGNEIFWIPTTNNVAADPSGSVAPSSGCSSSTAYSSAANATCAWSNLPNGTNPASGSGLGWTAYSSTAKCNSSLPATDRELFECEYGNTTGASTPPSDEYAAFRSLAQGYLAAGACATDTIAAQRSCIESGLDTTALPVANTAQHPYNYANPANGDHQYYATSTAGTATNATKTLAATNPMSNDSMFSWSGTNGSEQSTATPITVTVYRQTYSTSSNSWSTGVPQFTFTITHTDWSVTKQPSGVDYFPSTQDVTMYNTGATSTGTAAGSTGTSQPGDLYVQGVNGGGPVSLIGQDNVEVTGDITKGSGNDTSITNPISITAGNDVRNYHPVACVDQTAADINATTAGYCPNDITGLTSNALSNTSGTFFSWAPPAQYTNILAGGTRTIDAVLFTLSGSLHTDNFDRGTWVGNLVINGGVYQSHRGANGSQYTVSGGTTARTGTTLTYNYVNLTRADLQYVPTASYSTNPRVWNVVSTSAANNPASS